MKKKIAFFVFAVLMGCQISAGEILTPPQVWSDFDPDKGDFNEEIIKEETVNGIYNRESYISAYVLGEAIRVYCKYSVKAGARNSPGLMNVHGWMGAPGIDNQYVKDGWAVMAHDYCGKSGDRKHYTKYPEGLRHGNMDAKEGIRIKSKMPDGKFITDAKQTDDYLWYAVQRRALSYLLAQKEVDKNRICAKGYSYGGTIMWNLGMDPRVKAIVAYFGVGWLEYYRNRSVWMYENPYREPPKKSPGEEIYLAGVAPQAHVPYITAATLFLNGTNDHHGGHERGLESFKMFKKGVPWAFAEQARGHHNTEKIGQNTKLWLDKYVLDKEVFWPEHPKSEIRLDSDGVLELVVSPASPKRVKKVEMYYALKNPCSFARSWRDTSCVRKGDKWVGKMPVINIEDYVFGFANITYDNTVTLSTDFNAAIPSNLGNAKATDKKSEIIYTGDEGMGAWSNVAEVEGPGGIKGFRSTNNARGSGTEQLSDPKWKSPSNGQLSFKFYCTQPQTLIFTAADHYEGEIEITASDDWQEMIIDSNQLLNRFNKQALKDWSNVGKIQFKPKAGSDITKVIFAEFKWATSTEK
ncbi:MAG: prolyl oligopeptidase family serine peptidase [Phycisphaerae bacterium]|nr:prolyl oligopeptidase family serine peptidase [Phycisphaerae bacterium]